MSATTQVEGYKNFEDCDECGFVGPKPPDGPATNPLHAAIDIVDGQRWLIKRLDALLEEPLTWRVRAAVRSMRLTQVKNVERCEALIGELSHARLGSGETPARTRSTPPAEEGMT